MISLFVGKTKKNMRTRKKEERGKNFMCSSFDSFFKCSCSIEAAPSGEQSKFFIRVYTEQIFVGSSYL